MKYMKLILIALTLVNTSCFRSHKMHIAIAPEFVSYINEWHNDATYILGYDIPIEDLEIELGSTLKDLSGECIIKSGTTPKIIINTLSWNSHGPLGRKVLLYHELGHCVLMREHNNETVTMISSKGLTYHGPLSIMNYKEFMTEEYWASFQTIILTEYFGGL